MMPCLGCSMSRKDAMRHKNPHVVQTIFLYLFFPGTFEVEESKILCRQQQEMTLECVQFVGEIL